MFSIAMYQEINHPAMGVPPFLETPQIIRNHYSLSLSIINQHQPAGSIMIIPIIYYYFDHYQPYIDYHQPYISHVLTIYSPYVYGNPHINTYHQIVPS